MRRAAIVLSVAAVVALGVSLAGRDCGATTVLLGCVGGSDMVPGCQVNYSATYTVTAQDAEETQGGIVRFCLAPTDSSLCPSTSAIATLSCNGARSVSGDLNNLEVLQIRAKEGDIVRIDVALVDRNNEVRCFRLGETQFALIR